MARKWNPTNPDDIIQKYLSGTSEKAIAKQMQISRSAVRSFFIRNGIQPRGRSESMFVRMKNATPEERQRLSKAAHDKVRGMKRSKKELIERAIIRQKNKSIVGKGERLLDKWLKERGFDTIPQMAVDKFNIDIAIPPVAVELNISSWNPLTNRHDPQKIEYLTNNGWAIIYIHIKTIALLSEVQADYITSYIKQVRSDPSLIGEYRVIGRDAKLKAIGHFYHD